MSPCPWRQRAASLVASVLLVASAVVLRAQSWVLDSTFAPKIINDTSALLDASLVALSNGQLLVFGEFTHIAGSPARGLARLNSDGRRDSTFNVDFGADERVVDAVPLADGRVLAMLRSRVGTEAQSTSALATAVELGQPPSLPAPPQSSGPGRLVRLQANGLIDRSFSPVGFSLSPRLTTLPDGRVIVFGRFSSFDGLPRNGLARLNTDGTLDLSFAPSITSRVLFVTAVASGPNASLVISAYAYPPDFGTNPGASDNSTQYFLMRIVADGSIDRQFAPANISTWFQSLAVQSDGAVLTDSGNLRRYTPTGAIDRDFTPPDLGAIRQLLALPGARTAIGTRGAAVFILNATGQIEQDLRKATGGRDGQILCAAYGDGRLLVAQGMLAGEVNQVSIGSSVGGTVTNTTLRIAEPALAISNANFTALTSLDTNIVRRTTAAISHVSFDQANRVLVTGEFTEIDGSPRDGLARFRSDGTLDAAFVPTSSRLLLATPDGRPVVSQTAPNNPANGALRTYVTRTIRLRDDGTADPAFTSPEGPATNTGASASGAGLRKLRWLTSAPDGRLLVAGFEPHDQSEQNLKLVWLDAAGRRLTTLPTQLGGFTRGTQTVIGSVPPLSPVPVTGVVPLPTVTLGWINLYANVLDTAHVLSGDRLLLLGYFSQANGAQRNTIARLNRDGTLDPTYAPDPATLGFLSGIYLTEQGAPANHTTMRWQTFSDGHTLVSGEVWDGSRPQLRTVRIGADGAVDPAFQPRRPFVTANARLMSDGSYFDGGRRFTGNGAPDLNFSPEYRDGLNVVPADTADIDAVGRLWVAGGFTHINGQPRTALARYVPVDTAEITVQPRSQNVIAGRPAVFEVAIGTTRPASYQWTRNGTPLTGATSPVLTIPQSGIESIGTYRAVVTVDNRALTSEPADLSTIAAGQARLTNFSARSFVGPNAPQIAGFVSADTSPRAILLRATGIGLPLASQGNLPMPVLTLRAGAAVIAENSNAAGYSAAEEIARTVGAFPVPLFWMLEAPTRTFLESTYGTNWFAGSSLVTEMSGGAPTVTTGSGDGRAGRSLFEYYDTAGEIDGPLLRNFSIRGQTGPGDDVLITGFVISGRGSLRVLIRGIGPSLAVFGVPGNVSDPVLQVFKSSDGAPIASNTNWAASADIAATADRVRAFPFPATSRDTAVLLTLEPGAYTAQLSSASGATGAAMIELYVVDF